MKLNILSRLMIFALMAVGFWSCSNGIDNKTYADLKSYADDVKKDVDFISQADFKKVMEAGGEFTILDCREAEDYNIATITGAINIPRGMIGFSEKIQDRHSPVYVFSDNEDKSVFAVSSLKLMKFCKAKVIQGTWKDWQAQYPDDIQLEPGDGQEEEAAPAEEEGGCGG